MHVKQEIKRWEAMTPRERLVAAGIPLDQEEPEPLIVRNVGDGITSSKVFENRNGTSVLLELVIENTGTRPITLRDFCVAAPWCTFTLEAELSPTDPRTKQYHLDRRVDEVLNIRPRRIPAHQCVRGFILGYDHRPIPREYAETHVPLDIYLMDESGKEHSGKVRIWVDPTKKWVDPITRSMGPEVVARSRTEKSSLFSEMYARDEVPPAAASVLGQDVSGSSRIPQQNSGGEGKRTRVSKKTSP